MSTVDLVLLGMVADTPQSAYDVYKAIRFRNLQHWVKVGKATVFKNLAALQAKGYLRGDETKAGNMPAKTVYHITQEGYTAFCEMMHAQAAADIPLLFDFNAVVANVNKVPFPDAMAQLAGIRAGLLAKRQFIASALPQRAGIPLVGKTIMRQQLMVLDALLQWIDEFIPEFEQEYKGE